MFQIRQLEKGFESFLLLVFGDLAIGAASFCRNQQHEPNAFPTSSSAIRLDEPFELLAPLISQVVITTVTSGAVVQSQSVC